MWHQVVELWLHTCRITYRFCLVYNSLEIKQYFTKDLNGYNPGRFDTQMNRQSKFNEEFITFIEVSAIVSSQKYNYECNTRIV